MSALPEITLDTCHVCGCEVDVTDENDGLLVDGKPMCLVCKEAQDELCEDGKPHRFHLVSDWMGDPNVINGTCDCSYMECECGATREVSDEDRREMREEAAYARWEARQ